MRLGDVGLVYIGGSALFLGLDNFPHFVYLGKCGWGWWVYLSIPRSLQTTTASYAPPAAISFFPLTLFHSIYRRRQLPFLSTSSLPEPGEGGGNTHKQTARKRQSGDRDRQHKGPVDGQIIRLQDARQLARGRHVAHVGGAGGDDGGGVDAGGVAGNFLYEGVGEDVLGDGDGDGAAEGVGEDGDGVCITCKFPMSGWVMDERIYRGSGW